MTTRQLKHDLARALALFDIAAAKKRAADQAFDCAVEMIWSDFSADEWDGFHARNEALWKRRATLRRTTYATNLLAYAIKVLEKRK
jgi:hypothetical protein